MTITAATNVPPRRVVAKPPWGPSLALSPTANPLVWQGQSAVPPDTADGDQVFEVTAYGDWNVAVCRATCRVEGAVLDDHASVITD